MGYMHIDLVREAGEKLQGPLAGSGSGEDGGRANAAERGSGAVREVFGGACRVAPCAHLNAQRREGVGGGGREG